MDAPLGASLAFRNALRSVFRFVLTARSCLPTRGVVGQVWIGRFLGCSCAFGNYGPGLSDDLHRQPHGPRGIGRHGAVFVADTLSGALVGWSCAKQPVGGAN